MTTRLDLTGLRCPLPVIRLEAALRKALPGEAFIVSADDPLARIDLPHAARQAGFACTEATSPTDSIFVFHLIAPDP